ncbi:MAG TPA: DUF6580 family putative transport protein [Bacteroidota bacterium]|nr:DUF6580 family putative transport protein [Bacteroidota bacterium]
MSTLRFSVLMGMIVTAAIARIIPHPPNFTPIISLALFGGAYLENKRTAFFVPLAAMILSDLLLWALEGYSVFNVMRLVVYGSFAVITAMGLLLNGKINVLNVAGASVGGSVFFFLVTNLAVWLGGKLYPMDWSGLIACYVAAIPFFQNTLLSSLVYSALLFGGFEIVSRKFPAVARGKVPA